jgi:uncharacterized OB-fold protein
MIKKKNVVRKPVRSRKGRWDNKERYNPYGKRCKTCGKTFYDYSIVTGKREQVNCGKCRENACIKRTGHKPNQYR